MLANNLLRMESRSLIPKLDYLLIVLFPVFLFMLLKTRIIIFRSVPIIQILDSLSFYSHLEIVESYCSLSTVKLIISCIFHIIFLSITQNLKCAKLHFMRRYSIKVVDVLWHIIDFEWARQQMHFLNIVGPITPWITPIKPQNEEYNICNFQTFSVEIASWDPRRQIEDPFKSMKNKHPINRNIESITSENSTPMLLRAFYVLKLFLLFHLSNPFLTCDIFCWCEVSQLGYIWCWYYFWAFYRLASNNIWFDDVIVNPISYLDTIMQFQTKPWIPSSN